MLHKRWDRVPVPLIILLLVLAAVPMVSAHPAAAPAPYEHRLLHDNHGDWGGHQGGTRTTNGHDLLALDVRERWDPELGPVLEFGLVIEPHGWANVSATANGDARQPLKDVIRFQLDGVEHEYWFQTSDDSDFTTTFTRHEVRDENDNGRRALVGVVPYDRIDAAPGAALTDFQVIGYHGSTKEDVMGPDDPDQSNVASESDHYISAAYELRGPTYYATTSLSTREVDVALGETQTIEIDVTNGFNSVSQEVTLAFDGPDGVEASLRLDDGASDDTVTFELGKKVDGPTAVYLDLVPRTQGTSNGTLQVYTDHGGYEEILVNITARAGDDTGSGTGDQSDGETDADAGADGTDPGATDDDSGGSADDAGAEENGTGAEDRNLVPATGAVVATTALLATLLFARRRSG